MKHLTILLTTALILIGFSSAYSDDEHTDHDSHSEDDSHAEHDSHSDHDSEEPISRIQADMAAKVGIATSIAGSEQLEQSSKLFGTLASGPEQLSHVRARYEGLIKSVAVTIGDVVKTGDLLAEVESNDSLKAYKILAPISGRIMQRHANTGEFTQDQVLFSIANLETLWAELRVFSSHQSSVRAGQTVHILEGSNRIDAKIDHVVPSLDTPYQLARIKLDNTDQTLTPGLMVEAQVVTSEFSVDLAVHVDAIQEIEGRKGVFVKDGEMYPFTPLELGRRDDTFFEVLEGLAQGDEYVSNNSYLLKADLEKSEAEHEH
jgi:membrane fusion protein, heavy metal efflux system